MVDRLLRKLRGNDERDSLQEALLAIENLVNLKGNADDIMAAAETLVETCPEGSTALKSLRTVINLVTDDPNLSSKISVDFGLIKGIAYYDGIVFDITNAAGNKILGGGDPSKFAENFGQMEQAMELSQCYKSLMILLGM